MSTAPGQGHRFSIPLPRPPWVFVATVVLVAAAVGLHIGVSIYQQELAIRHALVRSAIRLP